MTVPTQPARSSAQSRRAVTALLYSAGLVGAVALGVFAQPEPAPTTPPAAPAPAPVPATTTPAQAPVTPSPAPATGEAAAPPDAPAPANGAMTEAKPAPTTPPPPTEPDRFDELKRRIRAGEPTVLSFKSASVSELLPLIVEYTGKVVMPSDDILARKITVVNDRPLSRNEALDLVFLALQQRDIAVIETDRIIYLRDKAEIDRQLVPIVPADKSLLERNDIGTVVQKVFGLKNGAAANIGDIVRTSLPDFGKLTVDLDSNQILITGPIALLQRMEMLITSLDKPSASSTVTETFRLRYADADAIVANIRELFQDQSSATQNAQRAALQGAIRSFQPNQPAANQPRQPGQPQPGQPGAAQSNPNFRAISNRQQNAVTVVAEPPVMEKIRKQVEDVWDKPLPDDAVVPRVFKLQYIDPIKARDTLEGLFGASSTRTTSFGGFFGGQSSTTSQGAGRLAGQFSFQASPDTSSIIVVAKSPDNMEVIEKVIADLDQPRNAGLPRILELKHATAEDLAEQLNALLAQEGTLAQIRRVNTDLSERSAAGASPFATTTEFSNSGDSFTQTSTRAPENLQFWWQRARPPTTDSGASTLVGKIRIVPIQRRNALMVMAPPEYTDAVSELIQRLDRPGRQVLISAVICEISAEDATALGLRFSNTTISPNLQDNAIGFNAGSNAQGQPNQFFNGVKNDLLPGLFDTSVLNVGVNLNAIIQALAQKTSVTILSEPRIFTGDNQEATFFDGQDIPFITDSQPNTQGNIVQSFDYRAVGINLRVRPRITPERDVDLKVDLELSSIQPNQTLFGGFIVDRRQTTTQLIVRDNQTVVISGIMRAEESSVKRKVPLIGDIPLIGELFKSTETSVTNTELVAFITPLVVENRVDSDGINDPFRRRLNELRDQLTPEDKGPKPRSTADPAHHPAAPASPAKPESAPPVPATPPASGH